MPGAFILIFAVVAVVIIALVIVGAKQAADRRRRLAAWAASMGLSFDPDRDRGFVDRYPRFAMLKAGDQDRYAFNVMRGERHERVVACFDYHYETTSTDSKGNRSTHSHHFSAVILDTRLPLRELSIHPESFIHRIGEFFGFDDIDFESAEFSRRFKVTSPDRRWAYDVIHPATMEFMLERPRYTLQVAAGDVMLSDGKRWDEAGFAAALEYAERFLDLIPPGVIAELKGATR